MHSETPDISASNIKLHLEFFIRIWGLRLRYAFQIGPTITIKIVNLL